MTEKQVFIIWMESLHKDVSTDSDGKFTDPETEARFRGWLGRADVQRAVEINGAMRFFSPDILQ